MHFNTVPLSVVLGLGAGFGVRTSGCWSDSKHTSISFVYLVKAAGIVGDFGTREVSISC